MKFRTLSVPLSLLFVIGTISFASPNAAYSTTTTTTTTCEASLDGEQEVPPAVTNGNGNATMEFDPASNELSWSIQFSGLTGPATLAHFHGPAPAGTNAGVQVNIGAVSGLESPMEGSAVLTAEQASMLLEGEGMMYINIHTDAYPNGEIRGQVSCESSPPAVDAETANVLIGGQDYVIEYTISGGTLTQLTADTATQTLMASISSTSDGNLTVWLPTEVIDAEDEFSVFIDDESGNVVVDELDPTTDARVLQIEFENGAEEIEIVGTSMVPEFGTIAILLASIAIVGAVVATTRFHKFGGLRI